MTSATNHSSIPSQEMSVNQQQQDHDQNTPNVMIVPVPVNSGNARYRIILKQSPLRARMCGFGNKDYRPVDPIPVIELQEWDDTEAMYIVPR